jgi:cytoskeletal protein RodZ
MNFILNILGECAALQLRHYHKVRHPTPGEVHDKHADSDSNGTELEEDKDEHKNPSAEDQPPAQAVATVAAIVDTAEVTAAEKLNTAPAPAAVAVAEAALAPTPVLAPAPGKSCKAQAAAPASGKAHKAGQVQYTWVSYHDARTYVWL